MNQRKRAAGVGFFIVMMLAMGIGMMMVVSTGRIFGQERMRYELVYDTSVKGLETGAPVTLKGVQIGEVISVKARFYRSSNTPLNSVVIDIYPGRIEFDEDAREDLPNILISHGLGAKLKMQSLLTGLLYVEVDFYNDEPQTILVDTDYPQIPTVPSDLEKLNDFNEVDFVEMAKDMQETMQNIRRLTSTDEFLQLAGKISNTMDVVEVAANKMGTNADSAGLSMDGAMARMEETMIGMKETADKMNAHLAPDSPLMFQLTDSLDSLGKAARSFDRLASMLEQQPGSVISGKRSVQQ